MKKLSMLVVPALVAFAACVKTPEKTVEFTAARSVWPAGLEKEMNTLVAFTAPLDLKAGDKAVLRMAAWYSYRVTMNGAFIGFGPARGPKGFFRPDDWDLMSAAREGRNELKVEVTGYNVPNFYLMEQPPFFKGEVLVNGAVKAATGIDGAFAAVRLPRVQKSPRYSYQRTFAEHYKVPGVVSAPLKLAAAPEPVLIPRRAPYPDFEMTRLAPCSFADVVVDTKRKLHTDRSLTLPGKGGSFKGFKMEDLELNTTYLAQQLTHPNRREATAGEKAADAFRLATGKSVMFDRGVNDTGFPGAVVEVKAPGRLTMNFDETLVNGEASGVNRYRDVCNVVVWDFEKPGTYEISAFEPYTMRYMEFSALSGEMTIRAPYFRSYKNPTAKRAKFRCSDPVLERIFAAASETFRQNAVDVFMDCPSRERAGWNCDAFFTAPVSTLLTGNTDLERVFEENIALPPKFDAIPDGAIPMCYPSDHPDGCFIPNWAMWFVLETEEYQRRSADHETIAKLRPRLEKLVSYLQTFRNSDGLLEKLPSWVFVEWSRCNKLVQDVNYPSNMTWADVLDAMDRLYNRPDLAAEAKKVREQVLKQSWNGKWFCDNAVRQKDGTLKLSGECTETCQYYAFFHKVATPKSHPELWKTMIEDFGPQRYDPKNRGKLLKWQEIWPSNAFIGNYLRLKLLEREGLGQQILRETKGYFQYMADLTGTLWENDTTCASTNHGFASYAAIFLLRSVLGIDNVDLVNRTLTLRKTDAELEFGEAELPVGDESIKVSRTRGKNGEVKMSASVPSGWRIVEK